MEDAAPAVEVGKSASVTGGPYRPLDRGKRHEGSVIPIQDPVGCSTSEFEVEWRIDSKELSRRPESQ